MALIKSPVQEVGFTLAFQGLPVNLLDVAALASTLSDEFPLFQQSQPLPPMSVLPVPVPMVINLDPAGLPRAWFLSPDSRDLVQFQNDRICYNWRRLAPIDIEADYPGYLSLRDRYFGQIIRFEEWTKDRNIIFPGYSVGELAYYNLIPMEKDGIRSRISDILKFYKPGRLSAIAGFQINWTEIVEATYQAHLNIQIAVASTIENKAALMVNLTHRFEIEGKQPDDLRARFDAAHEKIHATLPYILAEPVLETFR